MTELLLIRHGQTDHNAERRFQGHTETDLNDTGRAQARLLAERLRDREIEAIYTSDLARARQTAQILADTLDLPLRLEIGLREIDVGEAAGLTKEELQERHPVLFGEDWFQVAFPGGESYAAMARRTGPIARSIVTTHPDRTVALVSHGGAIRSLIAALTGIHIDQLRGLVVDNTSITTLQLSTPDAVARLRRLNDSAHLEAWAGGIDRPLL